MSDSETFVEERDNMNRIANRSMFKAALIAGTVAGLSAAANADVSRTIFSLTATNSIGTDSYSFELPADVTNPFIGGIFDWLISQPVTLNNGVVITAAEIHLEADPIVSVNFSLNNTAGMDSNIVVNSPLLSFASINSAIGNASASVTLTDPQGDGATLTPIAGKGYTAFYNGGAPQTGTEFANLFTVPVTLPVTDPFGSTTTETFHFPGPGVFGPMGNVADASAAWGFVLSDGDNASGSSTFEIVPIPGSTALIALGGLALIRRRR
jgi:MYXO-CTERM domain-containing protein